MKKKNKTEEAILENITDAVFLGSLGFIASEIKEEFEDREPFAEEKAAERKAELAKKKSKEFGEW